MTSKEIKAYKMFINGSNSKRDSFIVHVSFIISMCTALERNIQDRKIEISPEQIKILELFKAKISIGYNKMLDDLSNGLDVAKSMNKKLRDYKKCVLDPTFYGSKEMDCKEFLRLIIKACEFFKTQTDEIKYGSLDIKKNQIDLNDSDDCLDSIDSTKKMAEILLERLEQNKEIDNSVTQELEEFNRTKKETIEIEKIKSQITNIINGRKDYITSLFSEYENFVNLVDKIIEKSKEKANDENEDPEIRRIYTEIFIYAIKIRVSHPLYPEKDRIGKGINNGYYVNHISVGPKK